MIRDLDRAGLERLPEYDVCIVGSGPAGTTVANELRGAGLRLAILESGLARPTPRGDLLREVRSEGIHVKDYSRERVLGGASTTWAGLSSPLDSADMAPRDATGGVGWPIPRAELLADYERAAERYRFPGLAMFEPGGFDALRDGELQPEWRDVEEKVFLACAEPQNFAREHTELLDGDEVDVWLDATLLRLERDGSSVKHAVVRTRSGREHEIAARAFVLATGGLENARLLLVSDLGNEHDQVGRYLMNHPKNNHGWIRLARPVGDLPYYFGCLHRGYAGYAGLRLTEELQRERRLLNAYVRFEPLFPWSDNEGIESLVLLVKHTRFVLDRFRKKSREEVVTLRDYSETGDDSDLSNERRSFLGWLAVVWNVVVNLPRVAQYAWFRVFSRRGPRITTIRLRNFMEMEPHADNRVVLSDELDPDGQPRALVKHAPTELDVRSLLELHEVLVREIERTGIGKLETRLADEHPWPIDQDASHHMGTTRMGTDPTRSVVDTDCRMHSVDNLWVAGASVFPTSGCANPTFTIVALSIRLARHLREHVFALEAGGTA